MQSQASDLHGHSTFLYPCPCPLPDEGVDQIGVHHFHQFGRDHLRIPMFQVCITCPFSQKEFAPLGENVTDMDEACCGGFR